MPDVTDFPAHFRALQPFEAQQPSTHNACQLYQLHVFLLSTRTKAERIAAIGPGPLVLIASRRQISTAATINHQRV
jgi:hypothetical protein